MTLTKPDFTLDKPNPNSAQIPDAVWWLWLRCHELEPKSEFSGIYANKKGFHNTGAANLANWPTNYSIRDSVNRTGPWWKSKASALDWTFKDAQAGHYETIDKYTSRLMHSAKDKNDPRLDLVLFEFYGQSDTDAQVEGYNEYREEAATSDSSHLWHIHMSFLRSQCGNFWGMWALLTVLMGWTVQQWRASLPETSVVTKPPSQQDWTDQAIMALPTLKKGDVGPIVRTWQGLLCARGFTVKIDGNFGDDTRNNTIAFQKKGGADKGFDGIVGEETWNMGLFASDRI